MNEQQYIQLIKQLVAANVNEWQYRIGDKTRIEFIPPHYNDLVYRSGFDVVILRDITYLVRAGYDKNTNALFIQLREAP